MMYGFVPYRSGLIDFHEFCHKLIPPLEGRRLEVVEEVFTELDSSGDGLLQTSDIIGESNTKYLST